MAGHRAGAEPRWCGWEFWGTGPPGGAAGRGGGDQFSRGGRPSRSAFFGQARYREPSPWARVALVSANDGVRMSVEAGVANNLKKKFREVRGGFVRAIDLIWWWINYSDPVCPKV